jgi:hypothetical protein
VFVKFFSLKDLLNGYSSEILNFFPKPTINKFSIIAVEVLKIIFHRVLTIFASKSKVFVDTVSCVINNIKYYSQTFLTRKNKLNGFVKKTHKEDSPLNPQFSLLDEAVHLLRFYL